jgi:16S rRNA (cytosine1402-N4)-methyltransferase
LESKPLEGDVAETKFSHIPVLLKEAIDFLAVKRGGTYVDATLGLGGHSFEIAKLLGREGRLIGFDKPPAELKDDWPEIRLEHSSFANLSEVLETNSIDGLLADLGVSSLQLEDASRGFSFQADGPLDMRMNPTEGITADQVVNRMDETSLANVIYEFGEERRSRRIARAIVRARPIRTTKHLVDVVSAAARSMKHERIHPATRTFQGIRIFVNRELEEVKALLGSAPSALKKNGRVVIISFHSLEDRIVKDAIREGVQKGWYEVLTKKPVSATEEEIESNPRSRSAKLRAAEKI